MKKAVIILSAIALTASSCNQATKKATTVAVDTATVVTYPISEEDTVSPEKDGISHEIAENFANFLPKRYRLFDVISGNLNKDGKKDTVLIVKAKYRRNFVVDEYRGTLDRNRRGMIILLSNNEHFTHLDCFSSEHEGGGAYYAPELWFYIKKGNLYIHYGHGRYGYWRYTFRYKNYGDYFDFALIGYDDERNYSGPVVESATSINFLTKKKQTKVNTNPDAESGHEIFKEAWENIDYDTDDLILSKITDFDGFNVHDHYKIAAKK